MASLRKRNGKWQAQIRRIGHSPRAKSFLSKSYAQRWIRETELQLDRRALAFDPVSLERFIVADLILRYRKEVTPKKRGHASEDKRLEVFLRYEWARLPLSKVRPQTFSRYRDQRLKQVRPGTVIREMGLLHAIFEVAKREWDLPHFENPLSNIRKPRAPQGRERRLKPGELDCILQACTQSRNEWLEDGILLAIETGLRRGEILNIRIGDLDFEKALLSIPETKTGYSRCIPLTDRALAILEQRLQSGSVDEERLFPASAGAFRQAWERSKKRASRYNPDIATLRFHDLRHEAVSRFFEMGLTLPEVAAISGHKDPRMLFRYTHLNPEDIRTKLKKFGDMVSL